MTAPYLPFFAPLLCCSDGCDEPPTVLMETGDGSPIPGLAPPYVRQRRFCVMHAGELIGRGWGLVRG